MNKNEIKNEEIILAAEKITLMVILMPQRNSDIDYIRSPEPIVIQQLAPEAVPVPVPLDSPIIQYAYGGSFCKRLVGKFGSEVLNWHRMDYYANAIPLGSFCFALAFIIYVFYRCNVYKVNDSFLWSVILIFYFLEELDNVLLSSLNSSKIDLFRQYYI